MSDEIETIDRNPKSWAAWKREAERLQGIIDGMALAAMGSEPLCFVSERNLANLTKHKVSVYVKAEPVMVRPVALYRHAQPAPDGLIPAAQKLLERYLANPGTNREFITCWTPSKSSIGTAGVWDEWKALESALAASPQPAPERDQVRSEHAEWSQATFGNVGPVGPLKHLSKEALEAAAEPGDLSEWADMQFLLWDAQRRAGITDEQITQAMTEKLAVNKQREWPEPKDGEPRLHIKEQPAPVVPPEQHWEELCRQHPDMSIGDAIIRAAWWNHCRAAMLQAGNSPVIGIDLASGPDRSVDVRYVAPPDYVMVPKEPTDSMINAWLSEVANWRGHVAGYKAMLAAAPHDTHALNSLQSVAGVPDKWIPVSELMPGKGGIYLVWNGKHIDAVPLFFGSFQCVNPEQITHWRHLPAAPQEVKGE